MLATTVLSLFLAFWSALFLLDFYLRSAGFKRYLEFADRHGLTVSPFQLRIYTNRFFTSSSHNNQLSHSPSFSPAHHRIANRIVTGWFAFGAAISLISAFAITLYLSRLLLVDLIAFGTTLFARRSTSDDVATHTLVHDQPSGGLQPVIPGVNVPWSHLPLFLVVLVIAGVVHEMGHALAALNENVPVNGFGVFLLAIYPGAFTEIQSESLARATSAQKLRIYGAGIWQNFILAALAVMLLYSLPTLLYPFYSVNHGVYITNVDEQSGLSGDAGLRAGHVIYAINQCGVRNRDDWRRCVQTLGTDTNYGYCMPDEEVASRIASKAVNVYGEMQCCDDANTSLSHLCFYFPNRSPPAVPVLATPSTAVSRRPKLLDSLGLNHPRQLQQVDEVEHHRGDVRDNAKAPFSRENPSPPAGDASASTCVYPALFNATKLFRFHIANSSRPVLFIGHINELRFFVHMSDFVPRLPTVIAPVFLPRLVDLFARYLVTFSLAMALLNAVPCFSLDGQFIAQTLVDGLCHRMPHRKRQTIVNCLLYYGTFVLCANVVIGFVKFFMANWQ